MPWSDGRPIVARRLHAARGQDEPYGDDDEDEPEHQNDGPPTMAAVVAPTIGRLRPVLGRLSFIHG